MVAGLLIMTIGGYGMWQSRLRWKGGMPGVLEVTGIQRGCAELEAWAGLAEESTLGAMGKDVRCFDRDVQGWAASSTVGLLEVYRLAADSQPTAVAPPFLTGADLESWDDSLDGYGWFDLGNRLVWVSWKAIPSQGWDMFDPMEWSNAGAGWYLTLKGGETFSFGVTVDSPDPNDALEVAAFAWQP